VTEGTSIKPSLFVYEGPSMNPTFKAGDGLAVLPYGNRKVGVGDVIVFLSPENQRRVVHRVTSISSLGIQTRGDNNRLLDPFLLQPQQILGQVISIQRGKKRHRTLNGLTGHIYHELLKCKRLSFRFVVLIFHPLYSYLCHTKLLAKLIPIQLNYKIVQFQRNNKIEYQLLWHNRLIGRRSSITSSWTIDRIFRLVINESSLP
jgi:signal peptidase I